MYGYDNITRLCDVHTYNLTSSKYKQKDTLQVEDNLAVNILLSRPVLSVLEDPLFKERRQPR